MAKYYFTTLAARPMIVGGRTIKFRVFSISAGRASGVYKTEDPQEIAGLDAMVAGRRGIREISEAEYLEAEKKTSQIPSSSSLNGVRPRVAHTPPMMPEIAMERAGVPSAARPRPGDVKSPQIVPTTTQPLMKDVVRVERVNPPKPFANAERKTEKASKRADRAKIRVARRSEG